MMKKETIHRLFVRSAVLAVLLLSLSAQAMAYDAATADNWMSQFSQALAALTPVNDPVMTADPARAGQFLLEYEFGTVLSTEQAALQPGNILEIDVRNSLVTDCRGVRVGMSLEQALDGDHPAYGALPLHVLSVQEEGCGWSWAYLNEEGVYGVEYIAYGDMGVALKEYTLTYVIENDVITAIRIKVADATLAQAQDGLQTAQEIAGRQEDGMVIAANSRPILTEADLLVMGGKALGVPVDQLISRMGEPAEVQTLPQGTGRVLIYEGAVVTLGFNEMTGEEIVRAVSVNSPAFDGPNRLKVGMTIQEAGALVRCEKDVYRRGGMLYLEGEALGEAPYGELQMISEHEARLIYACEAQGDTAVLQVIAVDEIVSSWQLMYWSDMQGGV